MGNKFITSNGILEEAIENYNKDSGNSDKLMGVAYAFHQRINEKAKVYVPVELPQELLEFFDPKTMRIEEVIQQNEKYRLRLKKLKLKNGEEALLAFTNSEECSKAGTSYVLTGMDEFLRNVYRDESVFGAVINPSGSSFIMPKKLIEIVFRANNEIRFENRVLIAKGDIASIGSDCIVNSTNATMLKDSGISGALHKAAGEELALECKAVGECKTGRAKITRGYNLRSAYVIHTVGPIYSKDKKCGTQLTNCYWNCLELAKEYGIHSIAFPSISTGINGYPLSEASEIAVRTVTRWLGINKGYGMTVVFCCYDQRTYEAYQSLSSLSDAQISKPEIDEFSFE